MKRFTLLALSVVTSLVFAGVSFAQDYVPLVQKDTISITKINLANLDSPKLTQTLQTVGSAAVDYFVSDKEKSEETKKALPLVGIIVGQYFGTNIQPLKDAGADSVYFVVDQPEDASVTLYPYIAVPIKGMTDAQKNELRQSFSLLNQQLPQGSQFTLKYRFERNGFFFVLVVPSELTSDEVKAYMKARFTKIVSVDKPEFAEGFKSVDDTAVISGVTLNAQNDEIGQGQLQKIFEQLESSPNAENVDVLKETISKYYELGKTFAEHVKYNYWYVSLDKLEIVSNIQAKSAKDAEEYVAGINETLLPEINKTIDSLVETTLNNSEANIDEEAKAAIVEGNEQVKKLLKVFCQFTVKDSVITWKMDEKFWTDNKTTFDEIAKFVKEKLAAVQASEVEEEEFEEL